MSAAPTLLTGYSLPLLPRVYTDCRVKKIGKPVFRRYTPVSWGAWMKESSVARGGGDEDARVWVMKHFSGSVVLQYDNHDEFVADRVSLVHELPRPFYGTGHVVYRAAIYYHRAGTDLILRSVSLSPYTHSTCTGPY